MKSNKDWKLYTYEDAVAYIEEIPRFTKKHSLAHTREFLRRLGNPAADRKLIHVAGTNGKGSVCAYLKEILRAEGRKTGFFTSPHLVCINERIEIDGTQVDNGTFLRIFQTTAHAAWKMQEEGLEHPSYFEFLFGMGMKAFEESDVEYIILETGLGGRLDATNAPEHPVLTVITSISLDHTGILGDTVAQIAAEKAGIIKPGVPVFFDGTAPEASEVIRRRAEELGAPCREISKNAFEIREVTGKYIAFSRANAYDKDVIYRIPICGCYQAMNAELALEAAEYLLAAQEAVRTGIRIPDPEETAGSSRGRFAGALESVHWEGRMEEVRPHLILDGAHNPGAVRAFAETVQMLKGNRLSGDVILFSAVADKKYDEMIAWLCQNLDVKAFVVTEIADARKVPAGELADRFRACTDKEIVCRPRLEEALREALRRRDADADVYCLGSLYLAGMVKKLLSGGGLDVEF